MPTETPQIDAEGLDDSSLILTLREEIRRLERELARIKHGYGSELYHTEAVLAKALGYNYDEVYGWVTGDHTTVTLAAEAYKKITGKKYDYNTQPPQS